MSDHRRTVVIVFLLSVSPAVAQQRATSALEQVRLVQRVGELVPLDLRFTAESGRLVTLEDLVSKKPAIILPVFYRCPMLCTQVLNAMVRAVSAVDLSPGKDFEIIVFSFDPRETATLAGEKKLNYLRPPFPPEKREGWHFLVGDESSIGRLTEAIGYTFAYDRKTDQFAHPAAAAVITPTGRIARYLIGLDYAPGQLKLELLEAGNGTIGGVVDRVMLRCFSYDPASGRYGFAIMNALRVGGGLTVLALVIALIKMSAKKPKPANRCV